MPAKNENQSGKKRNEHESVRKKNWLEGGKALTMSKCALLGSILDVAELRSTTRTAKRLLHANATSMNDFVAGLPVATLDDPDADMRWNSVILYTAIGNKMCAMRTWAIEKSS